ncbi:MAG: hypothetical protein QXU69_07565 [Thermofilaceae archaeon]
MEAAALGAQILALGGGGGPVRLYEARLVLKSPAIVTARRTERGYVRPHSYIPGSTLRGAILTALYRAGKLGRDDLRREAQEPTLLASPGLPLANGRRTLPATPFMAACKRCDHRVDATAEAARALEQGGGLRFPLVCPRDGGPMEPLHGRFVYAEGGRLRSYRLRTFRATSVGISKERASAVKGLLFDYEAIAEGSAFWAWVAAPDNFELPSSLEVAVGRGQSRGFGWADLTLTPVEAKPVPERGAFIALSPLAPVEWIRWRGESLRVGRVVGREITIQLGWDILQGKMRPIVRLARPGSLVLAEAGGDPAALRAGLPISVADFKVVGLNSLIPLEEYTSLLGVR